MSTAAVGSANSLLNTYDPLNPSSALTTPAATATTGSTATTSTGSTATTPSTAPTYTVGGSTPAGFDVLRPAPNAAPAAPSTFQQAIDAFTVTADTFLIQSAINGQQQPAAAAAFGSPSAQLASLGNTIDVLKNASLSGNYGSLDSVV